MPRARVTQHVVEVLVEFTPPTPYATAANQTYNSTTLTQIVTGLAETIIAGCDLTATGSPASVTVAWEVIFSQFDPGYSKTIRLQLRRTNVSGAVLWTSSTYTALIDSRAGLESRNTGSYVDSSPTDYHYVLTIDDTAAGSVNNETWASLRSFWLNPTTTAIVSQSVVEVLVQDEGPVRVSQSVVEVLIQDVQDVPIAGQGSATRQMIGSRL